MTITRKQLAEIIDAACWSARSWGHDDNGLDETYDENGEYREDGEGFHHSAVVAVDRIMELL